MNRKVWTIVAAVVFAVGITGIAQQQPPAAKETTITGEVIDVKCGQGNGHEECANSCVRKGQAAGIKNKDGVYEVVGAYAANRNERSFRSWRRTSRRRALSRRTKTAR